MNARLLLLMFFFAAKSTGGRDLHQNPIMPHVRWWPRFRKLSEIFPPQSPHNLKPYRHINTTLILPADSMGSNLFKFVSEGLSDTCNGA